MREVFRKMRKGRRALATAKLLAACAFASALFAVASCGGGEAERAAAQMTGGDPARGRAKIGHYGCHTCHTIPGVGPLLVGASGWTLDGLLDDR